MKSKILKIISLCLVVCISVLAFCSCGTTNKEENYTADGVYQGDTKKVLRDLISSTDRTIDKALSIDDVSRYNPVGSVSGEILYSFNDISYIDLVKQLSSRMDPNVIAQELSLRGFYVTDNNLMFVTNSDFMKKQKLYLTDFSYFSALDEKSVVETFPLLEERINTFKEYGYKEMYYYKTLFTSTEKSEKLNDSNTYEVVYVLGRNKEGFKILDAVYTIGNIANQTIKQPFLSREMILDFVPNTFERKPKQTDVIEQEVTDTNENVLVEEAVATNEQTSDKEVEEN